MGRGKRRPVCAVSSSLNNCGHLKHRCPCLPGLNVFLLFNLITTTCSLLPTHFYQRINGTKKQNMTLYAGYVERYLLHDKWVKLNWTAVQFRKRPKPGQSSQKRRRKWMLSSVLTLVVINKWTLSALIPEITRLELPLMWASEIIL